MPRSGIDDAVREPHRFRQPPKPRRDPAAVLLGKFAASFSVPRGGIVSTTSRVAAVDAQRIAARLPVPADPHEIDRPIEDDFNSARLDTADDKGAHATTWPTTQDPTLSR